MFTNVVPFASVPQRPSYAQVDVENDTGLHHRTCALMLLSIGAVSTPDHPSGDSFLTLTLLSCTQVDAGRTWSCTT